MKKLISFFLFFLFIHSKLPAQNSTHIVLVNYDSIQNYLLNKLEMEFDYEVLMKKEGVIIVKKYQNIINIQSRFGCIGAKGMKELENYALDLLNQIEGLENSMKLVIEYKLKRNQNKIDEFLKQKIKAFELSNKIRVIPSNGILYHEEEIQLITSEFMSFVKKSKDLPKWIQNQRISKKEMSQFYMQLFLIRYYFKNYKYNWVREEWN